MPESPVSFSFVSAKDIVEAISALIDLAKGSQNTERSVLHLDAVQAAVQALGNEQQRILKEARRCDVSNVQQIEYLYDTTLSYLQEDNVRPKLKIAIGGLEGCYPTIKNRAHELLWQKADIQTARQAAAEHLREVISELKALQNDLVYRPSPQITGMQPERLWEIFELISKLRDRRFENLKVARSDLSELVDQALREIPKAHWTDTLGEVETLKEELRSAFNVKREQ